MNRELIGVGDRLVSIWLPGVDLIAAKSEAQYDAGKKGVISIGIDRLPGPMGFYLVANIVREEGADIIIPLHMAEGFMVSNP